MPHEHQWVGRGYGRGECGSAMHLDLDDRLKIWNDHRAAAELEEGEGGARQGKAVVRERVGV